MDSMENLEFKRADRIKNILAIPKEKRTEKQLLQLMNFTKVKK
jgi:hypothetical protein